MATTYARPKGVQHRNPPPDRRWDGATLTSAIRRQLELGLGTHPGQLGSAAAHAVAAGGKLLRPQLVLESCCAVGGEPATVLPAAVGTEFGHIASLVHDDIIDGDGIRRGQASVHSAFGVPLAILTGDLLVFEMFACYAQSVEHGINPERTVRAIQILSQACVDVCRGQALEAEMAGAIDATEAAYFEVIRLKTAVVCRAATEIGATLGGGEPAFVDALGCYGEALGMAFQIVDDLLEFTGDPDKLGKPLDSDVRNRRITLPVIYAVNSNAGSRGRVLELLSSPDGHVDLAALLYRGGFLARARQTAASFTRTAQRCLSVLPSSDARERLHAYAAAVLLRDR